MSLEASLVSFGDDSPLGPSFFTVVIAVEVVVGEAVDETASAILVTSVLFVVAFFGLGVVRMPKSQKG